MAANLPYLASPASLKTAFDKIKVAATPDRVTGDFVNSTLQIKGGTGAAIVPFLKKIGFIAADGSPTDLYRRFRNHATAGPAVAEAIRFGYKPLAGANEQFYGLTDKDLLALIVQVTDVAADSQVAKLTVSTLKTLKSYANFDAEVAQPEAGVAEKSDRVADPSIQTKEKGAGRGRLGLNLSHTINLNLPATSDQAVFNAICRSLKEHLLSHDE